LKAVRPVPEEVFLQLLQHACLPEDEVVTLLQKAMDPAYWEKLNPSLSVGGQLADGVRETATLGLQNRSELLEKLGREGYFQTGPLLSESLVGRMRACIEVLRKEHWPPVFAFVYDQFWQVARIPPLVELLSGALGPGYKQNSNSWCHYIPPRSGSAGWGPHMDGFNRSNRLSIWIPLSDATLQNGCMYVIPQHVVPETLRDFSTLENVSRAELQTLLQGSRAVPAQAGSVLGWHFQLIHWGSTVAQAEHARISLTMEFVGDQAEPKTDEHPLFEGHAALPTFPQRLHVIGKGILDYERFELRLIRYRELAKRLVDRVGRFGGPPGMASSPSVDAPGPNLQDRNAG